MNAHLYPPNSQGYGKKKRKQQIQGFLMLFAKYMQKRLLELVFYSLLSMPFLGEFIVIYTYRYKKKIEQGQGSTIIVLA